MFVVTEHPGGEPFESRARAHGLHVDTDAGAVRRERDERDPPE